MSQPLKKEQKTSDAAGDATTSLFLRVLRDANAVTHLSPFLTINDMTNLSMACKDTQEMFQKERESLSFSDVRSMVRRHTLIGYERKDEDLQWVAVSQSQNFAFRVVSPDQSPSQIIAQFEIENEIWDEYYNLQQDFRGVKTPIFLMNFPNLPVLVCE
eukprot:Sro564_g167460.2  (158) ;mRNA; r:47858-48331